MTKKKPSPQNRIWEKERRERLNKTFEDLQRLLPDHEPSSTLTKVEILQRAIEFIGKLQKKIKDLMQECSDPLKEQVHEQEKRLKRLLGRNEELVELLRKAKITVPPCKYTAAEAERQQHRGEEKENGNRGKKAPTKRSRSGAATRKQSVINQKHSPTHTSSTVGSDALAISTVNSVSTTTSSISTTVGESCPAVPATVAPCPSALKHINGISIGAGHGVNVTSALLSTPIMTTSVLISNNGNLVQMPIVAPPSSLLIVGSEDVRAKINLKNRPLTASGKGKTKRGKFMIKSIDVIPGRIVNGKIPIPPLRRSTNELSLKGTKTAKLKRKRPSEKGKNPRNNPVELSREKASDLSVRDESKMAKMEQVQPVGLDEVQTNDNQQPQSVATDTPVAKDQPVVLLPTGDKSIEKESDKVQHNSTGNPQEGHLEQLNLTHTDLPEDIFANLQVPGDSNAHGQDDGSLSPTAAYLLNFPLVAGGGKAAGNHIEAGDGDECDEGATVTELQPAKKSTISNGGTDTGGSMMLDHFSSFFNYGQMETVGANAPTVGYEGGLVQTSLSVVTASNVVTDTTTVAPSTRESGYTTNYTTIYQSIDNMLEHHHRPNRTTMGAPTKLPVTSESDYGSSAAFTFTLTSGTSTVTTTSQTGTLAANHFFGSSCGALISNPVPKPVVDDFSSPLKPSIEFTFSLTSTTGSQPHTVQSQYTNSAILATTMTTPSYDTYGYYHKPVAQPANYCSSFGVLDPLLTTEKPATSFTFSLTSSTKTEPSYTQSSLASVPTHAPEAYETTPKPSSKIPQHVGVASECYPQKTAAPEKSEKVPQRSQGYGGSASLTVGHTTTTGLAHQPALNQSQQQTASSNGTVGSSTALHHTTQASRYDVSWMAAGTHNPDPIHHPQQQQQSYELAPPPPQIISSLDFPVPPPPAPPAPPGGGCYPSSYKSDIFFAHPPGDENNLTWSSPSKLSNILNDSSSPYFPPVTLPSLNGDLALNTSIGTGTGTGSSAGYKLGTMNNNGKKERHAHHGSTGAAGVLGPGSDSAATGSSFLSVSQLVNQPVKSSSFQGNGNTAPTCPQKPLNNNYSAEALIGNSNSYQQNPVALVSAGHEPVRKDKLFDYGCSGIMEGGGFSSSTVANSSGTLTFNFDTYGTTPSGTTDFNKGYNFATQSSNGAYVPPFATDSVGGGVGCGNPGAITGVASCTVSSSVGSAAPGMPYYGTPSAQGFYQQPSGSSASGTGYAQIVPTGAPTVGQEFASYYLPTFGEKMSTSKQPPYCTPSHGGSSAGKMKKTHKTTGSSVATNYSYPSLTNSSTGVSVAPEHSTSSQVDAHPFPNYNYQQQHQTPTHHQQQQTQNHHHHHHHHPHQHHSYGSAMPEGSSVHPSPSVPPHKSSSMGAYNYRQNSSSSSAGFGSGKSIKTSAQERGPHDHHSSFPPVHGSNSNHLLSHAHLDLSSCHNPSGHGNSQSTVGGDHLVPPQATVNYGTSGTSRDSHLNASNHHQQRHHDQTTGAANPMVHPIGHTSSTSVPGSGSCGTITNFNLSTICPEINDKTGRTARDDTRVPGVPSVPLSIASLMTHW